MKKTSRKLEIFAFGQSPDYFAFLPTWLSFAFLSLCLCIHRTQKKINENVRDPAIIGSGELPFAEDHKWRLAD